MRLITCMFVLLEQYTITSKDSVFFEKKNKMIFQVYFGVRDDYLQNSEVMHY